MGEEMVKAILFDFWGTLMEQGVRSPIQHVKNALQIDLPFSEYVVRMERAMMTEQKYAQGSLPFRICGVQP